MVYKTLTPAESSSSDLAERILLHLRLRYADALNPERISFWHKAWENLEFGFDWTKPDENHWQRYSRSIWFDWLVGAALVAVGPYVPGVTWALLFGGLLLILMGFGHLIESRRINRLLRSNTLKPDIIDQVISGVRDASVVQRYVPFLLRELFVRKKREIVEEDVTLVAVNLDWFSARPRVLIRWTWICFSIGVASSVAAFYLAFFYSSSLGAVLLLAGLSECHFADVFGSWRRRIFLGLVISHIEKKYIGDPVEDFKRLSD